MKRALVTSLPTCVLALLLGLTLYLLPVVYETIDDPAMGLILEGDNVVHIAPDPHGVFVHYLLGWMVSALSTRYPKVPWYGLLIGCLYVLAYTVLGENLMQLDHGRSHTWWPAIFQIFFLAFALLPLLLLQFTILAGVLALAGMLPAMRYAVLEDSGSCAAWSLGTVCLLAGLMFRSQMAAAVIIVCLPPLSLALLLRRDLRRARLLFSYILGVAIVGSGLHYVDRQHYDAPSVYGRLREFNRLLFLYAGLPSTHQFQPQYAELGWSANDHEMFSEFMGLDTGPFRLETIQRVEGLTAGRVAAPQTAAPQTVEHTDDRRVATRSRLWVQGKLERLLERRDAKDILRAVYLLVIFGAAGAWIAGGAMRADSKHLAMVIAAACAVAAAYGFIVVIIDRPVFRVVLPLAYVLLVFALVVYPWPPRDAIRTLPHSRRRILVGAMAIFCLMGGLGLSSGIAQAFQNRNQQGLFRDMIITSRLRIGGDTPLVAWPDALPLQYLSPFEERPPYMLDPHIYHATGSYGSYPASLDRFRHDFGNDVYAGLLRPGVAHLVSSLDQLERLKRFSLEHHGRRVVGTQLGEFEVAYRTITLWVLTDAQNPWSPPPPVTK